MSSDRLVYGTATIGDPEHDIITVDAIKKMLADYNPDPDPLFVDASIQHHPMLQRYSRRTGRKIMTNGDIPRLHESLRESMWLRTKAMIWDARFFGKR